MESKLRNHLYYHWWFYPVSALLVIVFWLTLFSKLAEPKANEQVNITFIGESFDHLSLQRDLYDVLPEKSDQVIKRISVENAAGMGEYELNTIIRARMAGACDIFIIENSIIEEFEMDLASYFPEIDAATFDKTFGNAERVTENGKIFGLSGASGTNITFYYSGKSQCKIFLNKNSVNLSDLFGGNKEQDAALQIVRYLMEKRDV